MRTLLFRYCLKHHLTHRFRLAMVILSLALGVAIFVSSYESVVAAQDSITAGAQILTGKVTWQVSRGRFLGVEESLTSKIRAIPGAVAAPMIQSTVFVGPPLNKSLMLLGVDLQSDAASKLYGNQLGGDVSSFFNASFLSGGLMASSTFAKENGLQAGSVLKIQGPNDWKSVSIAGTFVNEHVSAAVGGNVGVIELHAAEALIGKPGMVDRIDVAGVSKEALQQACPQCQIDSPNKLSSAAEDALGRIRSLLGVSVIALMVGILLIYNSVQISILERVKDIAIIRAIGATRVQIFGCLLLEWAIIGIVGSGFGVGLGSILAFGLVEYTKRSINSMVPLIGEAHVQVGPTLIAIGMAIGVLTTVSAAFFPVWTAANVRPLEILRPYSFRRSHRYGLAALIGIVLCVVGNVAILRGSVSMEAGLGIVAIVCLGVALIFPQIVLVLSGLCRPWLLRLKRPEPFLALDGLLKTPHRTAFTIMTFGSALAMMVSTETLVEGFRVSTGQWMNSAFPFDISVMGNDLVSSVYGNQAMPKSMVDKLGKAPGVQYVYGVRKVLTPVNGQDVMVVGVDPDAYIAARHAKNLGDWPPGMNDLEVQRKFRSGKGTFVSTNFAQIFGKHTGQMLSLQTPSGTASMTILGEVDDYSWPHGCFIVDLHSLWRIWNDDALSYIDVGVLPGYSVREVKATVAKIASTNRSAYAYDRKEIKDVTDSVLEQAVAMANMQAAIAVLIGMIGIVNAIWIGVINRKKEIALWRAIGISRRQIRTAILYEGLFVSVIAGLMGAVGGLYGGWVPLRAFSFDITGYIYPLVVPWVQVAEVAALAIVLGLTAGLLPAYRAAKLPILESIGYE